MHDDERPFLMILKSEVYRLVDNETSFLTLTELRKIKYYIFKLSFAQLFVAAMFFFMWGVCVSI